MALVSILSLTWNRAKSAKECYQENINNCGIPREDLELLVADQGSNDGIVELMRGMGLAYHRLNKVNEGVGRSFNQLMVRATGEFICLAGTDIKNQPGWLAELINYARAVPNAGIVGIKCTAELPPLSTRVDIRGNPCHAHYLDAKWDKVFGTMLFNRHVLETVGGFHEGFHPYGFEDSDFNNRVTLAGFQSLYVPAVTWQSTHICNDVGETSVYRKMKDESLARNMTLFGNRHQAYVDKVLEPYEPLPMPRPPLEVEEPLTPVPAFDLNEVRRIPIGE